jgi:Tfp pilus assembly protein PilF
MKRILLLGAALSAPFALAQAPQISQPPQSLELSRIQRFGASALRENAPSDLRRGVLGDLVKVLLEAELMAANGERADAALRYAIAARVSDDPAVAQRAAELAALSDNLPLAREMAKRWNELDVGNAKAREVATALAMAETDVTRSLDTLMATLPSEKEARAKAIVELARTLVRARDRTQAVNVMRALAAREKSAAGYLGLAISEFVASLPAQETAATRAQQDVSAAMAAATQALALDPAYSPAATMRAELISRKDPKAARDYAVEYLKRYPQANEVRGFYAGAVADTGDFKEARTQYLLLTKVGEEKTRAEAQLAAAAYAVRLKEFAVAETELEALAGNTLVNADTIKLYRGQAAEGLNQGPRAIEHWRGISKEARFWKEAQWRIGNALAKDNQITQARLFLEEQLLDGEEEAETRVAIVQSHAGWLREAKQLEAAFGVLSAGMEAHPDNADLLYDSAMIAERLKRMDVMEKQFRAVIGLRPDSAAAYNALGFSFAERNVNLADARQLLDRAILLAPDDAAIMDSVGWVAFREGKFTESEMWLRKAYEKFRDGEIAAHLAEVLIAQNRRDEAKRVLDGHGDKGTNPELVRDALKKFFGQ